MTGSITMRTVKTVLVIIDFLCLTWCVVSRLRLVVIWLWLTVIMLWFMVIRLWLVVIGLVGIVVVVVVKVVVRVVVIVSVIIIRVVVVIRVIVVIRVMGIIRIDVTVFGLVAIPVLLVVVDPSLQIILVDALCKAVVYAFRV